MLDATEAEEKRADEGNPASNAAAIAELLGQPAVATESAGRRHSVPWVWLVVGMMFMVGGLIVFAAGILIGNA